MEDKMRDRPNNDNLIKQDESSKEKPRNKTLEILTGTTLFPFLTFSAKLPLIGNSGTFWSDCYLGVSTAADAAEIVYRTYVAKKTGEVASNPYSCFEKHIFYDVPKFLYEKIFGRGGNDE